MLDRGETGGLRPAVYPSPAATSQISIWGGATFELADSRVAGPAEVGLKFYSEEEGLIAGVRFYKNARNTGPHEARLWSADGKLLASAAFSAESRSGWQQATFKKPERIDADKTYFVTYTTLTGHYTRAEGYFAEYGVYRTPLVAEAGIIRSGTKGFSIEESDANFGVDVVFDHDVANDKKKPNVKRTSKKDGAIKVNRRDNFHFKFDEPMNPSSVNPATVELYEKKNNARGKKVPSSVAYNAETRIATLTPATALEGATTYELVVKGSQGGVEDRAGNQLAGDYQLGFTTEAAANREVATPGAPILVVTTTANPFSSYYTEILRAEGLNSFSTMDVSALSPTSLAAFDVVLLGEMPLTADQVSTLTSWVTDGGNLIAMRPDKQLAGLLGIADASSSRSDAYLQVNTTSGPGVGIVGDTMQYHGTADHYFLAGATSLATLYSTSTISTAYPAATLRSVGTQGGQAAAFTYDLARSVVTTRQGNPAWSGQERDGFTPIRANDLFFGNAAGDPQPDWIDLNKVAIPQADEQQRLLANLISHVNADRKPLPRFWYFPRAEKAVVLMTGDDHGIGGTIGRFEQYISASPPGASAENWEAIRGTSYIYPNTPISDAEAAYYSSLGFEIALHVNTNLQDWATADELRAYYTTQLAAFRNAFPSIPSPSTNRTHAIAWGDYATQPKVELENDIRLDTNYYYWPPAWVSDRPGFFTGSGMPMRFADLDGTLIDVYQAATQMTDESGQSFPFTINTLLDRALGPEGYYGVFTANMHTDFVNSAGSDAIITSAVARGVPVVSSRQMLTWLDGRNNSTIESVTWDGNILSFNVVAAAGANGLTTMLPKTAGLRTIGSILRDGSPVAFTTDLIKGVEYAIFESLSGSYSVEYQVDLTAPTVASSSPTNGATGVLWDAAITVSFSEQLDPASITPATVFLRDPGGTVIPATISQLAVLGRFTLTPQTALAPSTTYTVTIVGGSEGVRDLSGNPLASDISISFTTSAALVDASIWDDSVTPAIASANDTGPVELGVKFRSQIDGLISGVRFYKGPNNLGTHVGRLWDSTGNLLASVTFADETAEGWQTARFAAPISVLANRTYVATYHAPFGGYAFNGAYFNTTSPSNGPIRALLDGEDGGNGVFRYGPGGDFPGQSFNSANYWVDVIFSSAAPASDTLPPTVTAATPAPGAAGVATTVNVTVTFNEPIDPTSLNGSTFVLRDPLNATIAAALFYDPITRVATLDPSLPLAFGTTYTATIAGGPSGVKDLAGNPLASDYTWTFTTGAEPDTTPPTVVFTTPAADATGVSSSIDVIATFSEVISTGTLTTATFVLRDSSSNLVAATITFDQATRTATLDPTSDLAPGATYTATILGGAAGVQDLAGNALAADYTWSFTVAAPLDTTPPTVVSTAPAPGETGVAAYLDVIATFSEAISPATVNAASFVLRDGGNNLVAATIAYDAVTRTASLDPASDLTAGATYTATILGGASGVKDLAGNALAADYIWSFTVAVPLDTTPPTVVSTAPAAGETGVAAYLDVTATFSEAISPATVTAGSFVLRDGANNPVAVTIAYDAVTRTASLDPASDLTAGATYTATILGGASGVKDLAGNALAADYIWSFTVAAPLDTTPPTVVSTAPAAGETGVAAYLDVTATFSEAISPATVNAASFVLRDGANNPVAVTIAYDAVTRTASLDPASDLTAGATYTATILGGASGVKDLAGNALAADYTWTFTVAVASGLNPIVVENQRPGNPASEWDIVGAGSSSIQGFATEISVDQGQTVYFKVDTSATDYRLDIYRLGYYGGLGARKITTVEPSVALPQSQPAAIVDAATGLYDAGNWQVSASWNVPADATSGIYLAKLVREDGVAGASHIVFVVRDDDGGSDIVFQTSDTTWQAYNNYGGKSLYDYQSTNGQRAYKVSYNRPFNTRETSPEDWLFNAEYPMLRWLEANGYDVSYTTGVDTDRYGSELLEHRLFLSVGHDEYWSGGQRANVEAARDAGVNLAFLSGNDVYWKTRWESSIAGPTTPHRTLVTYKETAANQKIDPSPEWTGTWRDPRFSPPSDGGRPENELTGTLFLVNDGATTAIEVPAEDGKMRLWRNTSVASLSPGQVATLSAQTLGYEWNVVADNGFSPPGLVRMSTTTVQNAPILLDYGSTYGSGPATHHLTLYRHSSGARVFSAGSVQWSWGLDSVHDRSGPPSDVRIRQATVNLLADFGIQPDTLQPDLVPADATTDSVAPTSVIVSPASGSVVSPGSAITISGTATDLGGVVGGVEISVDGGLTWKAATGRASWTYTWTPSDVGTVIIRTRAVDDSGNLEVPGTGITIELGNQTSGTYSLWPDSVVPSVISDNESRSVELGVKFQVNVAGYITGIRFYKGPFNVGTHRGRLWSLTGTQLGSVIFTGETATGWQTALFASPIPVQANVTYVASYLAPRGRYSINQQYFASSSLVSGPITALRNGQAGGNGVYRYGTNGGFPNRTWNASNYWVDVVFTTELGGGGGQALATPGEEATRSLDAAPGIAPSVGSVPASSILSVGPTQPEAIGRRTLAVPEFTSNRSLPSNAAAPRGITVRTGDAAAFARRVPLQRSLAGSGNGLGVGNLLDRYGRTAGVPGRLLDDPDDRAWVVTGVEADQTQSPPLAPTIESIPVVKIESRAGVSKTDEPPAKPVPVRLAATLPLGWRSPRTLIDLNRGALVPLETGLSTPRRKPWERT